jgi:hypothetical protein
MCFVNFDHPRAAEKLSDQDLVAHVLKLLRNMFTGTSVSVASASTSPTRHYTVFSASAHPLPTECIAAPGIFVPDPIGHVVIYNPHNNDTSLDNPNNTDNPDNQF